VPTNLHIVTGAPGTGKTALLRSSRTAARTVAEPAREVLAQQRSVGGDSAWDRNPERFVELLLQSSIDKYEEARMWGGVVVFDRGIPDCIAYAELAGIDPTPSIEAATTYRYNRQVLVTRPWEEIYTTDDERKGTFADAVAFHRLIESAYDRAGYTLVEIPRGPVEDRAAYVRSFIGRRDGASGWTPMPGRRPFA